MTLSRTSYMVFYRPYREPKYSKGYNTKCAYCQFNRFFIYRKSECIRLSCVRCYNSVFNIQKHDGEYSAMSVDTCMLESPREDPFILPIELKYL